MKRAFETIILGGFAALIFAIIYVTGIVSFSTPSFPSFSSVDVRLSLPREARITDVEPISLDCRARVHAEIPVEGKREHEAFGVIYRTDRISMHAYGDVDTCVDGSGATITHHADGTTDVVISGESIVFVRPRVDAVRTAHSVNVNKDFVGKIVDAFPWVDDNLGLTPAAYAYAQNVIGSSECMRTAYGLTQQILVDAYTQQVVDQGVDADKLTVVIEGEPHFVDPAPLDSAGLDLQVGDGAISCLPSEELGGSRTPSDL